MYVWDFDEKSLAEFSDLPRPARRALIQLLEALILVDPMTYQQSEDQPDQKPLRCLPFGEKSEGLVTVLIHPPDSLVLVVRIQWLG
ncbi:hypothetical protein [Nocardiopsis halophila]|uniref:hypothetical protein n=1 Tax=Nocardiopsis halophila TaxID=141692 RepID=UPI0003807A04|nr:hypothetical protein [Nocardiopsis halophila]